jgi:hypothetical protein
MVLTMGLGMEIGMDLSMGEWGHGNRNNHGRVIPPTRMLVFYFEIR